ncbi:MAG: NAD(P)-binding protein [Bacteroidia bacterium]
MKENSKKAVIISAGPAGFTAAYFLAEGGYEVEIFEASSYVGGIARMDADWAAQRIKRFSFTEAIKAVL